MSTNTKKNEKTIERINAEGTPFTLTRWDEEWLVMLGNYVLLRGYKSAQEAEMAIETESWSLLGAFIYAMIDHREKEKKHEQGTKES